MGKGTFSGFLVAVLLVALIMPLAAHAQFDEKQLSQDFVNDLADILTPAEEAQISGLLMAIEQNSTIEMAVITANIGSDDDIFEASLRAAEFLGVGKSDVDNGIVLFIAPDQRSYFIQVGQGLEGAIPDAIANRIGDQVLAPAFQQGAYARGIQETIMVLAGYGMADETAISQYQSTYGIEQTPPTWVDHIETIIMIIVFILLLSGRLGLWPLFFIPMGGNRGGGFKGGFGGGFNGFGGFGGGGFGGGGAGGRW